MELHVSSREAASSLDELLDRVTAGGTIVIERDGLPVAKLVATNTESNAGRILTPADLREIQRLLDAGRSLNDGWAEGVEEAVRIGNLPMKLEDPRDH